MKFATAWIVTGLALIVLGMPVEPAAAQTAKNLKCKKCVDNKDMANKSVSAKKIKNNAVTGAKIKDGAVTSEKIPDGAVTTEKIPDGAITSAKIAGGAVTEDKLESGVMESIDKGKQGLLGVYDQNEKLLGVVAGTNGPNSTAVVVRANGFAGLTDSYEWNRLPINFGVFYDLANCEGQAHSEYAPMQLIQQVAIGPKNPGNKATVYVPTNEAPVDKTYASRGFCQPVWNDGSSSWTEDCECLGPGGPLPLVTAAEAYTVETLVPPLYVGTN